MQILKQSTEIIVHIGQFVDATDNVTPETGITLGTADQAEIMKSGATAVVDISGATWAAVTGNDGTYNLTLTTSHTDTLGGMEVTIADASVALPIVKEFFVVPAHTYDSLFADAATDYLPVDVIQISSDTTAADNLEAGLDGVTTSTCTTSSTTTAVITNLTEATDDHYNGKTITFTSGDLAGQSAGITDYNGTTKTLTVTALTSAPANTDAFVIQ